MGKHHDLFGLAREKAIVRSGARMIFTPHKPISEAPLLYGRQSEVRRLIEYINTPGQHALLYGDRGVGKSSLANVSSKLFLSELVGGELFVKRCDSGDTFETIVVKPLQKVGADYLPVELLAQEDSSKRIGLNMGPVTGGGDRTKHVTHRYRRDSLLSPSVVAETIGNLEGLLLIDEADAIQRQDDRRKLAELIKHLSDAGSAFKILMVGIAQTGAELTAAHPSVQRCLKETKLTRMTSHELRHIVVGGAEKLRLQFDDDAVDAIVDLSAGYPHFTHLLALKCAEEAIAVGQMLVQKSDLATAMSAAVADAEGTLKATYDTAVRSSSTDMFRVIIVAAATLSRDEFTAEELRQEIEARTGAPISQGSLNNYFQRLVSEGDNTILRRVAKGVYRFQDARMPSYVRIANHMLV